MILGIFNGEGIKARFLYKFKLDTRGYAGGGT